ncbi:MAG: Bifunctional phosphoglucose/phosphomannose isomerase [Candidatus Poribacteria bacterium]|nr:Bifunctional phosphoglucose/phosphomannose isomerase [Candidatus Poribacteria bacterium]
MHNLDNPEIIENFDKSDMKSILLHFADQYREAKNTVHSFNISESYGQVKNIVISGMGGSAIGGDLTRSLFSEECPIPIVINRDYGVPRFVDDSTFFIAVSYSGNTEETISAFENALERKAKIISISCGGKLQKLSKKAGTLHFTVEKKGLQPRCAFGYLFVPIVYFLSKTGLITDQSQNLEESAEIIKHAVTKLSPDVPTENNKAKQLAINLFSRLPVIYAPQRYFDVVAMRWKGQINENSKMMAFHNVIPEMNHNEIVGWGSPIDISRKCVLIILTHKDESSKIRKRIDIAKSLITKEETQVIEIQAEGKSLLAKALYLIYLGDFVSYYLAMLNGVDPTPIERILILRSMLES